VLPPLQEILSTVQLARDWHWQNLPSMTVPLALLSDDDATVPDSSTTTDQEFAVLDMCCAPGGKTSHLVSLLFRLDHTATHPTCSNQLWKPPRDKIRIVACDKSRRKVVQARDVTWKRLGCSHDITPLALDTTQAVATVPLSCVNRSPSVAQVG
jgi:16S rRNA C967 or C1407 C5-methylase (RsmB/RsmF family)